ncbi:MAG: YdcF family protein [Candidatus Aminicenantes bacterium]|nr:YdcF family protein [Candidatus Aminicenantes bacterium]
MMFILKKILAAFFLPPGLIITLLFAAAVVFWRRKFRPAAVVNLALGMLVWVTCLVPVSDALVSGLEKGLTQPDIKGADAIVVLSGYGDRTAPALQLQRRLGVPIIFAGYISLSRSFQDRENFYRLLEGWGVPRDKVILETKSRDTLENLRRAKEICRVRGFRSPLVVSSAFHGKRILLTMKKTGFQAGLFPVDFNVVGRTLRYTWRDALPDARAVLGSSQAANEYLGLLFYSIFY